MDVLFLLNFIVNYLLLLATAKITVTHTKRMKLVLAALFGACYSVFAFFPSLAFLLHPLMRIVPGVSMVLIAFSHAKFLLRLCLIFFAVSAGFGGLIFALSLTQNTPGMTAQFVLPINFPVLISAFLLSYALFHILFARLGRGGSGKIMDVSIGLADKRITQKGLVDTGHSLTCPMTQNPIFIASAPTLAPLFPASLLALLTEENLKNPVDLLPRLLEEHSLKFYLVPYTVIGQPLGFLLCFAADEVSLDAKKVSGVRIALSPTPVSDGGHYQILIHGGFQ